MPTIEPGQVLAWDAAVEQFSPAYVGSLPPGPGSGYELAITPGTTSQYWRGDKTWQTLDKTAVGLVNVLNVAQEPAVAPGSTSQYWRGDKTWQTLDTSIVPENGNLYYTNARADARIALQKGAASGLATLGADSKIPNSQLPALAITDTFVVASQAAMLALSTAETGDVAVRTDLNESFILAGTNPATLAHWQKLLTPTDTVLSVNGQTGAVTLTTTHVTEGTNQYFTNSRARLALSGTSNQINYDNTTGVFSLPQNVHTGATPQFAGLGLGVAPTSTLVLNALGASATTLYGQIKNTTAAGTVAWLAMNDVGVQCEFGVRGSARATYGALLASESYFYSNGSLSMMCDTAAGVIKFATGGNSEKVRIDASGNLLVGTTSAGGYKFNVAGSGTFSSDLLLSGATANLFLADTSTGFKAVGAASTVINLQTNNSLRSGSFTSGLVGWGINAAGDAEFANVTVRGAIRSSVLLYNAVLATNGSQITVKASAKLRTTFAVPSAPTYGTTPVNIDVADQDGLTHAASQLFAVGDYLYIKDGINGYTIFKVSSASDQTSFWRYVCTVEAGTANVTYNAGLGVLDYGASGGAGILLTADQGNAPYLQMFTHAGVTAQNSSGAFALTPLLRLGNLNGSYGYGSSVYGLGAGQYGAANTAWFTLDQSAGFRIGQNTTTLARWFATASGSYAAGDILVGQDGAGQSNVLITAGKVELRNNTTAMIRLAADGSGYLANTSISWNTAGALTVSANATVAGWAVSANAISNGVVVIASNQSPNNAAGTAEAWFGRSAAGATGVFMKGTTAAYLTITANNSFVGAAGRPYLGINDGTRFRVVIGELNTTAWDGAATNSMGLKVWDAAGGLLVHFSDVANVISGWTIGATSITSTGVALRSGASANLAFGSMPPTASNSGTGVFIDATGFYGLAAGVTQVKVDATTGKLTAAAGDVVMDSAGLQLNCDSGGGFKSSGSNAVRFTGFGGYNSARIDGASSTVSSAVRDTSLRLATASPVNPGSASTILQAANDVSGDVASLSVSVYGVSYSTGAYQGKGILAGAGIDLTAISGRVLLGSSDPTVLAASAILEVNGQGALLVPRIDTTARNALTAVAGMIIYNTSTSKFQGYAGASWVDLH